MRTAHSSGDTASRREGMLTLEAVMKASLWTVVEFSRFLSHSRGPDKSGLRPLPHAGRFLQLADVLGPVPGEQFEALASGHDLSSRAPETRRVEIRRAPSRAVEAGVG